MSRKHRERIRSDIDRARDFVIAIERNRNGEMHAFEWEYASQWFNRDYDGGFPISNRALAWACAEKAIGWTKAGPL